MPTGVYPRTKEHREKLSKTMKEIANRPEVKQRMAETSKRVQSNPEVKRKHSEAIKNSWKDPEIRAKRCKGIKKAFENPEFKERKALLSRTKWADDGYKEKVSKKLKQVYSSTEMRTKISNAVREACSKKEERQRKSQATIKTWQKMNPAVRSKRLKKFQVCGTIARQLKYQSPLEKLVYKIIEGIGLQCNKQEPIGPYLVDIYLPEVNLVIECDGEYWHSLPGRAEKDRERDQWLLEHGYKVIRLKEKELKTNPDAFVVQRLKEVVG
ncbi:MAG: DUF559 domain-containing protein [Eubacteriales bacterium]